MNRVHFSSAKDEWETPQDLFDELSLEFEFVLDAAAMRTNAKCNRYLSHNSLELDWVTIAKAQSETHAGAVWLNPPYGRQIGKWVAKASATAKQGTTVVCLLPSRTDTRWWHSYIWDKQRHEPREHVQIRLVRGRLKFGDSKNSAPFPSAVVVFKGRP